MAKKSASPVPKQEEPIVEENSDYTITLTFDDKWVLKDIAKPNNMDLLLLIEHLAVGCQGAAKLLREEQKK